MTTVTSSGPAPLPQTQHYIRFSITPPTSDALHVRRALQEALVQSFGAARSHAYLDVLWVADSGTQCVVRTGGPTYVPFVLFRFFPARGFGEDDLFADAVFL